MNPSGFDQIIQSGQLILVDFFATWCGPCKTMSATLRHFKDKNGDKIRIVRIDTDKAVHLSSRYKIRSVPTLILFKGGRTLWRKTGAMPLSVLQKELSPFIKME